MDEWIFVSPTHAALKSRYQGEDYSEDEYVKLDGDAFVVGALGASAEDNVPTTIVIPKDVILRLLKETSR